MNAEKHSLDILINEILTTFEQRFRDYANSYDLLRMTILKYVDWTPKVMTIGYKDNILLVQMDGMIVPVKTFFDTVYAKNNKPLSRGELKNLSLV